MHAVEAQREEVVHDTLMDAALEPVRHVVQMNVAPYDVNANRGLVLEQRPQHLLESRQRLFHDLMSRRIQAGQLTQTHQGFQDRGRFGALCCHRVVMREAA